MNIRKQHPPQTRTARELPTELDAPSRRRKAFVAPSLNEQGDLPLITAGTYDDKNMFDSAI